MGRITNFIQSIGIAKLALMGCVTAAMLIFFTMIVMRVSERDFAMLYADLSLEDAAGISAFLESAQIPYEIRGGGGAIYVPPDRVLRLRMQLAERKLPGGAGIGYEVFDKSDSFGTTSFVQNINKVRALEGELARTIATLAAIRRARVHLVLPKRRLFQQAQAEPSASIVIHTSRPLEPIQIRAIQHLVASAIEGLKPGRVSVIDEHGQLLADGMGKDDRLSGSLIFNEQQHKYERKIQTRLQDVLGQVIGYGRVRVQVSAQMSRNRLTKTSETFDPDSQVARSVQSREENSSSIERSDQQGVTVGNELPGDDTDVGPQSNESSGRNEEVTNFEISKTVQTETLEPGMLERQSIAVLVDGTYTAGENGTQSYSPRSEEELDMIERLVKSAVGFDSARGDVVDVVNLQFKLAPQSDVFEQATQTGFFGIKETMIIRLIEILVLLLGVLAIIFFAFRPLMRHVVDQDTKRDSALRLGADGHDEEVVYDENGVPIVKKRKGTGYLDQAWADGEEKSEGIKKVGEMVETNPDAAANVIRSWLNEAA